MRMLTVRKGLTAITQLVATIVEVCFDEVYNNLISHSLKIVTLHVNTHVLDLLLLNVMNALMATEMSRATVEVNKYRS